MDGVTRIGRNSCGAVRTITRSAYQSRFTYVYGCIGNVCHLDWIVPGSGSCIIVTDPEVIVVGVGECLLRQVSGVFVTDIQIVTTNQGTMSQTVLNKVELGVVCQVGRRGGWCFSANVIAHGVVKVANDRVVIVLFTIDRINGRHHIRSCKASKANSGNNIRWPTLCCLTFLPEDTHHHVVCTRDALGDKTYATCVFGRSTEDTTRI